jgi:hypothetical protein
MCASKTTRTCDLIGNLIQNLIGKRVVLLGSADQRISGGWSSHGGAEARLEQREETATGPGGQLARPVLLPAVLEPPWLPTGISTRAPVIHPVRVHK